MKILFYATSPNQSIGYSKIANKISNYLASFDTVEFYYIATGNFVETMCKNRFINPRIKFIDVVSEEFKRGLKETDYGMILINDIMNELKPDIFLIYNDIIVICRLFNQLLGYREQYKNVTKFIAYIDLVYPNEKLEFIQHVDRNTDLIYVFSEYWKTNLVANGVSSSKIKILLHGMSSDYFKIMPQKDARKYLGMDEDDFIILNTNRNCYRKGIDITIRSFLKFFKDENKNKKIKLFLNMYINTQSGYDLISIIKTECIRYQLEYVDVMNQIITPPANKTGRVSDDMINYIYNIADIGINTCFGEGFGLCNFEHAHFGKPQIVSAVGGLNDIFKKEFSILVKHRAIMTVPNMLDGHSGDLHICDAEDFTEGMKFYYHNPEKRKEHGVKIKEHVDNNFNWEIILGQFSIQLNEYYKRDTVKTSYYDIQYTA